MFRDNTAKQPADGNGLVNSQTPSKFLYTEEFSYLPGKLFCLTNGSGTVLEGDFDEMLLTKLQALWTLRQTIKGEGNSYEIENGKFILRAANVFQQGDFKGLAIEVTYTETGSPEEATAKIVQLLASYGLAYNGEKLADSAIEIAWRYVDAIQSR